MNGQIDFVMVYLKNFNLNNIPNISCVLKSKKMTDDILEIRFKDLFCDYFFLKYIAKIRFPEINAANYSLQSKKTSNF